MVSRICRNSPRETMASAIWKMIDRPGRTIFAPILISRSRNVVINQWLTCLRQGQGAEEVGEVVCQGV